MKRKWIKVSKRLPDEYRVVETKCEDGQHICEIHLMHRVGVVWVNVWGHICDTPTHWRAVATGREL